MVEQDLNFLEAKKYSSELKLLVKIIEYYLLL